MSGLEETVMMTLEKSMKLSTELRYYKIIQVRMVTGNQWAEVQTI